MSKAARIIALPRRTAVGDLPTTRCTSQSVLASSSPAGATWLTRPISAARAAEIGLVNHVAPAGELDAKTDWLVQRVVGKSPTAVRRGKAMMRAAFDMSFEQSISYLETQIMTLALTEDAKEGRASFVEKRAPNWTGR